jgi:hypothetical protein
MPISRRSQLECRTSLLALAIATAGASVHFAIEILVSTDAESGPPQIRCPGRAAPGSALEPSATASPAYLEAVELRCRAAEATRCDIDQAIPSSLALQLATPALGSETPDLVFLRFAPLHRRVVWTVTDTRGGLSLDIDAFDGTPIELTDAGVTTH